jgi:hypothetical protein
LQFSDLKAQFSALLNRRDLTASLTTTFYQMAVQRIQRELRVPAMESLLPLTTDGTDTLTIPGDYLEAIALFISDNTNNRRMTRCDLNTIMQKRMLYGLPTHFHRIRGNFIIGPVPPTGQTIYLSYYQDASGLSADTDHNWLTDASPDLLIYAMLSYAANYYADDRKQVWEQTYLQIANDLQDMAVQDELAGAAIGPAFITEGFWDAYNGW